MDVFGPTKDGTNFEIFCLTRLYIYEKSENFKLHSIIATIMQQFNIKMKQMSDVSRVLKLFEGRAEYFTCEKYSNLSFAPFCNITHNIDLTLGLLRPATVAHNESKCF